MKTLSVLMLMVGCGPLSALLVVLATGVAGPAVWWVLAVCTVLVGCVGPRAYPYLVPAERRR